AGQRQIADAPVFPEAVPEALAVFVRETLETSHLRGVTPPPTEFVNRFETIMSGPAAPDFATRLRGSSVAVEEMESVGSVSDFDDDRDSSLDDSDENISPISRRLHAHEFDHRKSRSSSAWPVWAAAAVVILGLIAWWMMSPVTAEVAEPKIETKQQAPAKIVAEAPITPKPVTTQLVVAKTPEPPKTVAAKAPAPATPAPVIGKPAPLPMTPPAPIVVPNPVIIRKALLPSVEEIAKFKQGQVKPQTEPFPVQVTPTAPQQIGSVPTMNMAQPLDPARAQDRR
ncbi:MAG: hypothetical protein ABL974_16375, partial [Prosthecobacter sp.]